MTSEKIPVKTNNSSPLRLRTLLPKLLLATGATLLALLICEIGLRLANYSAPIFRQPDELLGWRGVAGLKGWHRVETKNLVALNSQGYFDRERQVAKTEAALRVAVVGDSYVQAAEVPLAQHFVTQLEQELNHDPAQSNSPIEVINFGVSGYSPTQELLLLRQEVSIYQPDIVVLVVYVGNDITDNLPELATSLRDSRPYFRTNTSELELRSGYPDLHRLERDGLIVAVVNRLRLLQLFKELALKRHTWGAPPTSPIDQHLGGSQPVLNDQPAGDWITAWHLTERLISEFAAESAARSARFFLVIVPFPIEVHPHRSERDLVAQSLSAGRLDYASSRLAAYASAQGLPFLSLAQEFAATATAGVYLHGFDQNGLGRGHWNVAGHTLTAQVLSQALRPIIAELAANEALP